MIKRAGGWEREVKMIDYIDLNVRLYLESGVDETEAQSIVDTLEYGFEHNLISTTDIYHYEVG